MARRVSQGRLPQRATIQGKKQLKAQAFRDEYLEFLEFPRNPKVLIDKVCDLSLPRASPEKAKRARDRQDRHPPQEGAALTVPG